jgi:hypothetical protein
MGGAYIGFLPSLNFLGNKTAQDSEQAGNEAGGNIP